MEALTLRFCDEFDGGFGWIAADELEQRCSHTIVVNGRAWVVDPLDGPGVEARIRDAGEPAGVIQLLDRHNRGCAELARRLGVPLHVVPERDVPPFEVRSVRRGRWWKESAIWWPERRVLVCADALGTAPFYRAPGDVVAVHPALRLRPPTRAFAGLAPTTILCGHGEGVFDGAEEALAVALRTARRRIPAQLAAGFRAWRATRSS